jgi:hypothetical protein
MSNSDLSKLSAQDLVNNLYSRQWFPIHIYHNYTKDFMECNMEFEL